MNKDNQIINKLYKNYFSIHHWLNDVDIISMHKKNWKVLDKNLWYLFNDPYKKVLEIWSWPGNFASFLKNKWFKNYTWLDLSKEEIDFCKNLFNSNNFKFIHWNIFDINDKIDHNYDIIFTSHIFEHLSLYEWYNFIWIIKEKLKRWGIWINIMPNADAYFYSYASFCWDITHKRIYNASSFSDLLKLNWFKNIEHRNPIIGSNLLQRLLHKIAIKVFNIILILLSYWTKKYYTSNLITIIKK